jgi:ornithine carbamoyltransferase
MKRDFIAVWDFSDREIEQLLKRAVELKTGADVSKCPLLGKSIGMIFEKPSTRTRISFEVGIYQLGGQPIYMNAEQLQLGRGEPVSDTAKVMSRYLSGVVMRTYLHSTIEEFAQYSSVPVINGLSDLHHPCQALADLMTIYERKGKLAGIKLAYIGDGNNVANSLIEAAVKTGFNLTIACPEGFEPDSFIVERAKSDLASKTSGEILISRNPFEAATKADVIYTDVWVSMGQEKDAQIKKMKFRDYQINSELLTYAKDDVIVLHCLPAHRGEEITDEVINCKNSAVFDQAENRLHSQKALLEFLIAS